MYIYLIKVTCIIILATKMHIKKKNQNLHHYPYNPKQNPFPLLSPVIAIDERKLRNRLVLWNLCLFWYLRRILGLTTISRFDGWRWKGCAETFVDKCSSSFIAVCSLLLVSSFSRNRLWCFWNAGGLPDRFLSWKECVSAKLRIVRRTVFLDVWIPIYLTP